VPSSGHVAKSLRALIADAGGFAVGQRPDQLFPAGRRLKERGLTRRGGSGQLWSPGGEERCRRKGARANGEVGRAEGRQAGDMICTLRSGVCSTVAMPPFFVDCMWFRWYQSASVNLTVTLGQLACNGVGCGFWGTVARPECPQ